MHKIQLNKMISAKGASAIASATLQSSGVTSQDLISMTAGAKMPDGSIYLGLFDKKDWYVAETDALNANGFGLAMTFHEACDYASALKAHDHDDWMLPPGKNNNGHTDILDEIRKVQDEGSFKDTFNRSSAWYWSSSESVKGWSVWGERLTDGHHEECKNGLIFSVRAVRAVPRL